MYLLCMDKRTTMQIENKTLKKFLKLKKYPRETNNDVLMRLIKKEIEDNAVSDQDKTKKELHGDNNDIETPDAFNSKNKKEVKNGN